MRATLFASAFLLSACVSAGPTNSPEFASLVQTALPADSGNIHFTGIGTWEPNSSGYNANTASSIGPAIIQGVATITDRAVLFAEWNGPQHAYTVIHRTLFSDIRESHVVVNGAARELVIQRNDVSYDSYEFTRGIMVDGAKADEAQQVLTSLMQATH